jgi:hypothetical protein
MNEPDFEEQLRALRPAAPRPALETRIQAELAEHPRAGALPASRRSWSARLLAAIGWSAVGATAAIVAVRLSHIEVKAPAADASAQLAAAAEADIELEHELLAVAEEGVVDEPTDGLARVVRYESLERRRWTDQDGAITVLEVPREDLVFVPVSFQ